MANRVNTIEGIQQRLRKFSDERDWAQFHSPKNLAMALAGEVGELIEIFQWLTERQSTDLSEVQRAQVRREIADVQIYLLRLADVLDIDLLNGVETKISENEERYPSEKVKGSAKKYTEY